MIISYKRNVLTNVLCLRLIDIFLFLPNIFLCTYNAIFKKGLLDE